MREKPAAMRANGGIPGIFGGAASTRRTAGQRPLVLAPSLTPTATTPRFQTRVAHFLRTQNTTHSMARHIYERLAGHNEDKTAPAPTWREALQLTERPRPGPRPFSQPQRGGCPDQLSPSAASGHSGQRRPAMRARAPVRAPPKAACEPEREAAPLCRGYGGNAQCALRRRRKQA